MLRDIDLRSLAEIRGNGRDVVSAYFRGRDGLERLRDREQQLADLLADDQLESENFQRSMATVLCFRAQASGSWHFYGAPFALN